MEQILKVYAPIFQVLEFRYQASQYSGTFNEFVLTELLASIEDVEAQTQFEKEHADEYALNGLPKTNQAITKQNRLIDELYDNSKSDRLMDVLVDSDVDFASKPYSFNYYLVRRLIDYDERYLSDNSFLSSFNFFWTKIKSLMGINTPAMLIDIPEFVEKRETAKVHQNDAMALFRVFASVFIGALMIPSMTVSAFKTQSSLEYLINNFGYILAVYGAIFFVTSDKLRHKFQPLFKIVVLATLAVFLTNHLKLLSQHQLYLLNYDVAYFAKFMIIVFMVLEIIMMLMSVTGNDYSMLRDSSSDGMTVNVNIEDQHWTGNVMLYKRGSEFANVNQLALTMPDNYVSGNFEHTSLKQG